MRWLLLVALVNCAGERAPSVDAAARRGDDDGGDCYRRCLDACTLPEQARICQDGCDESGAPNLQACGAKR